MEYSEIANKVLEILGEQLGDRNVTAKSRLKEDLQADDLDRIKIVMCLEEDFRIVIPEGEVVIDPPVNFYAGQLVSGNLMRIAADSSAPESGPYNSKLRIGADWYITDDADLMVRAAPVMEKER